MSTTRDAELDARFDSKFARGEESVCWEWFGWRNERGYGMFHVPGGPNGGMRAHRFALERRLGRPLRDDELALHHCDNPPCVNPAHLYAGTHGDNVRDMVTRGRNAPTVAAHPRGERHHRAKLTAEDVRAIRASTGTFTALGKIYGVHRRSISLANVRQDETRFEAGMRGRR